MEKAGELLAEVVKRIQDTDHRAESAAQEHWNAIAHPLHSLGKLEDVIVQIAGIQGTPDVQLDKKGLITMCADNGIVAEGVTQTGQEVTAQVSENFLSDKATAAILCRQTGADIFPIDIGIARQTSLSDKYKISFGTKDFLKEPAMSREDTMRALETGIRIAEEKQKAGYRLLATGEMGIGNTTTSSAVASVLLQETPEKMTGRGAGLTTEGLNHKVEVIREGIRRRNPDPADPVDVLSKVGGLDLAGMTGVFLGGAFVHVPVVIDGFISAVAALAAVRLCPLSAKYIIASHVSKEPAAQMVLAAIGKSAFLTCDMCLGEGTGAVMLFPLLDLALSVYRSMSTFEEDDIDAYKELL